MTYTDFIKEKKRLTEDCNIDCRKCRLSSYINRGNLTCKDLLEQHPEEAETIMEKWAKDCPKKTRQSELLKILPNTKILTNGAVKLCPKTFGEDTSRMCKGVCAECMKKFWLTEIEEEEDEKNN